jgi:serine/threonine protein kinase/cytochrome c-type biogenesis protein CcmH/NrfG
MGDSQSESETKEVPFGHWAYEPESPPEGASLVGRILGRYKVIDLIGRGAMSEVYRAQDQFLGREVAIKVLRAHLSQHPLALARLERERKAVTSLSHPNILAIQDAGTEHGIVYEVMELLDGETLRSRLRRSPLRWEQAAPIAIAISEGLDAAHRKGIIHRDLKPENVFITKQGTTKILDFGIARITSDFLQAEKARPEEMHQTMPGTVLGSVGYMSPEQARGETAEVTSDIFSLGCILYEMIAARRPFSKPTEAETLAALFTDEPLSLLRSGEEIPGGLDEIVRRCLQKNPRSRFQSAQELSRALQSILFKPGAKMSMLPIAVLPFLDETGDASLEYLSDGIAESLARELSHNPRLRVVAFSTASRYRGKAVDRKGLGRELGVKSLVCGSLSKNGEQLQLEVLLQNGHDGSRLWEKQSSRRPTDLLSLQAETVTAISSALEAPLSAHQLEGLTRRCAGSGKAYRLYLMGLQLLRRTPPDLSGSLEYFNRALDEDANFALAYLGVAEAYYTLSHRSLSAREAVPQAKAACLRAIELQPDLFEAHALLGVIKSQDEWDWSGGEAAFRRALELCRHSSATRHRYGIFLVQTARSNEATLELDWAQRLDPLSARVAVAAVWPLVKTAPTLRQHQNAIQRLKRICALHPQNIAAVHLLAICYADRQRYDEASTVLVGGLALEPDNPHLLSRLGYIYGRAGDGENVRWALSRLAEIAATQRVSPVHTALVHTGLGEREPTFDYLERAYQERDRMLSMLKVDPAWDEFQSDTRFRDLLRRIGLEPSA